MTLTTSTTTSSRTINAPTLSRAKSLRKSIALVRPGAASLSSTEVAPRPQSRSAARSTIDKADERSQTEQRRGISPTKLPVKQVVRDVRGEVHGNGDGNKHALEGHDASQSTRSAVSPSTVKQGTLGRNTSVRKLERPPIKTASAHSRTGSVPSSKTSSSTTSARNTTSRPIPAPSSTLGGTTTRPPVSTRSKPVSRQPNPPSSSTIRGRTSRPPSSASSTTLTVPTTNTTRSTTRATSSASSQSYSYGYQNKDQSRPVSAASSFAAILVAGVGSESTRYARPGGLTGRSATIVRPVLQTTKSTGYGSVKGPSRPVSPAKSSTFSITAYSAPSSSSSAAYTAKAQIELLRLHILHSDADVVLNEWLDSAKTQLGTKFTALAAEDAALRQIESRRAESCNVAALLAWADGDTDALVEKLEVLDDVVCGLLALTDRDGRCKGDYENVVGRFEAWFERAEACTRARNGSTRNTHQSDGLDESLLLDEQDNLILIGELGGQWKDGCAALAARLDSWRRDLRGLGDVPGTLQRPAIHYDDHGDSHDGDRQQQQSALARILERCRQLVLGMLAEIDVMERVEADLLIEEEGWVRGMVEEADEDDDHDHHDVHDPDEGRHRMAEEPLWRTH